MKTQSLRNIRSYLKRFNAVKKNNRILALAFAGFFALTAYAVDPVPVMRTNITDATEANVAEVFLSSGRYRLGVDAGLLNNPLGSASGGTAGTSSFLAGGIYNSSAPTLTNGQQSSLQLTVNGALKTDASVTSTVGSYQDKSSFTYGTDKFNPTGGIYQDTSPTLSAGQVGVSRMTANRGLHVNIRDASGTESGTHSNKLKTEDNFNSKVRSDASFTSVSLTTGVCTTYYSYSGSGVLIGFSSEFSNNNVIVKALVDGENILPSGFSISQLNSLNALANSTDRRQSGSGIVTSGATIDWSLKKPIRFNTSVLLCADANGGGIFSRSFKQGIVYLTKE